MKLLIIFNIFFLTIACGSPSKVRPPMALKKPFQLKQNGDIRTDNYYWMRDRENPMVIDYLNAENEYLKHKFKSMNQLKENIFNEMKGRIKKDDTTVPVRVDNFFYYRKYNTDSEYPIIARKSQSLAAKEETVLDSNLLAKGEKYFNLGNWKVGPKHQILAYATDLVGRRIYTIDFVNLKTGEKLPYKIEGVTSNFVFAEDDEHVFYTQQNPKTLRYEWIYRFSYKTGKKTLIFHEKDPKFYVSMGKTTNKKFIFIRSGSSESSEWQYINAKKPKSSFRIFQLRQPKHEYSVDHAGKYFVIHSNKNAENFKVYKTPDNERTAFKHWRTLVPHRKDVLISSLSAFKGYFILNIRKDGTTEIEVIKRSNGQRWLLEHPEQSHVVYTSQNPSFDIKKLRYSYQSPTTPSSIIDYDLKTRKKEIKKVQEVLGDFDPQNYASERIFAFAKDGKKIPISVVYKKGFKKNSTAPLLLYGYGSYGASMEPWFSSNRLSLLNRGFAFAVAHIRGGSEMGRSWYLDGKFLKKKNTFSDFISVAQHLIAKKYSDPKKLYAMGGSAGGLLMGAVINMQPSLFSGIVAQVPFVDVLTTMLDESIPLTTNEFEEWGNPKEQRYYEYIKSYSPYDNIKKTNYPPMLISSGLHDSQVQYWEPTKWVAKLREYKTDNNILLLDTNMEAGHGGKSGRFKRLEDTARDYTFLLHLAGIEE